MGVDRTFDYVPSLEAEVVALRAGIDDCRSELARSLAESAAAAKERDAARSQLLARDLECVRLRAAVREQTAYIEALTDTLDGLYATIDEAAQALPEVRAESVKLRAAIEQWKALVQ